MFAWLRGRDIPAAGPPFWKYNVIDMDRLLEVEVGVPVTAPVDGDDRSWPTRSGGPVRDPAVHGHPDGLIGVIASLREWARQDDPHQPPAFVIVDLMNLQPFGHRPSLGDRHPAGKRRPLPSWATAAGYGHED